MVRVVKKKYKFNTLIEMIYFHKHGYYDSSNIANNPKSHCFTYFLGMLKRELVKLPVPLTNVLCGADSKEATIGVVAYQHPKSYLVLYKVARTSFLIYYHIRLLRGSVKYGKLSLQCTKPNFGDDREEVNQ